MRPDTNPHPIWQTKHHISLLTRRGRPYKPLQMRGDGGGHGGRREAGLLAVEFLETRGLERIALADQLARSA